MKNIDKNKIIGIPVIQNKQDFLIGVFQISQIFEFTKYTKRLIVSYDDDEEPIYNNEIQREVENPRVQKIADFLIHDPEATFPTNIVLHIPKEIIEKQTNKNDHIEIYLNEKVFEEVKKEKGHVYISIIDGQHRIRGIEIAIEHLRNEISNLEKTLRNSTNVTLEKRLEFRQERLQDLLNIEIIVSFFIDKTLEYQAMVFSTINRTQKRVSPSLVYSLFGLDTRDTPQKTALQVTLALNSHNKSPFYKRIKLYGGSYKKESPPLTQATMVRSIINLICENLRESEKDRFRERKELFKRSSGSQKNLPFRQFYAKDEDQKISNILFYFFDAVRNIFIDNNRNSYWEFGDTLHITNIFHTTVGYESLLKILIDILEKNSKIVAPKTDFFTKHLQKASSLNISDTNRYSFNNRGKKILYIDFFLKIWPDDLKSKTLEQELIQLLS